MILKKCLFFQIFLNCFFNIISNEFPVFSLKANRIELFICQTEISEVFQNQFFVVTVRITFLMQFQHFADVIIGKQLVQVLKILFSSGPLHNIYFHCNDLLYCCQSNIILDFWLLNKGIGVINI